MAEKTRTYYQAALNKDIENPYNPDKVALKKNEVFLDDLSAKEVKETRESGVIRYNVGPGMGATIALVDPKKDLDFYQVTETIKTTKTKL